MPPIALNPGFVCILAALIVLGAPRSLRPAIIGAAAIAAIWLMLGREFGADAAARQMGLPVIVMDLDALNRIFGIAMLMALVILAIATGARRSRAEDAAILVLAGGAVSALFVGDLISYLAASSLAGLATAWMAFASPLPNSAQSGVRLLIWQGVEGLLFLVGVAFQLSAGANASIFAQLNIASLGGAFIFAAVLVRGCAPLAHVWLKDAIAHASPVGGAAVSAFSTMLGVYALLRFFPAEPLLIPIGLALGVIGALYALAEDDFRRAAAGGLLSQAGVCMALIGIGSPLAFAAAEAHAFTATFAFVALLLSLGAILGRRGEARASSFDGAARAMPITGVMMLAAGLAVSSMPGLATYVTTSIALEAAGQWETWWAGALIAGVSAALLVALMLRPALIAYRGPAAPTPVNEAPFSMILSAALAVFFCLAVGIAPAWLYGLLPTELAFQPYALDRMAPQLELLGAAGVAYLALYAFKLSPAERRIRLLDVDAVYRGPAMAAARWSGIVLLRVLGAAQTALDRSGAALARRLGAWARDCDRPYRDRLTAFAQLGTLAVAIAVALWWRQF